MGYASVIRCSPVDWPLLGFPDGHTLLEGSLAFPTRVLISGHHHSSRLCSRWRASANIPPTVQTYLQSRVTVLPACTVHSLHSLFLQCAHMQRPHCNCMGPTGVCVQTLPTCHCQGEYEYNMPYCTPAAAGAHVHKHGPHSKCSNEALLLASPIGLSLPVD